MKYSYKGMSIISLSFFIIMTFHGLNFADSINKQKAAKSSISKNVELKKSIEISSIKESNSEIIITLKRITKKPIDKNKAQQLWLWVYAGSIKKKWRFSQIDPGFKKINSKKGEVRFHTQIKLKKPTKVKALLKGTTHTKELTTVLSPKTITNNKTNNMSSKLGNVPSAQQINKKHNPAKRIKTGPLSINFDLFIQDFKVKKRIHNINSNSSYEEVDNAHKNESIQLHFELGKNGYYNKPRATYKIRFYIAPSISQLGSGNQVKEITYRINSSNSNRYDILIPDAIAFGRQKIFMVVDDGDHIQESNEQNNIYTLPFEVKQLPIVMPVQDSPKPDLIIENITISSDTIQTRDLVYVEFDVVNQGNATAASCQYSISTGSGGSSNYLQVDFGRIPSLVEGIQVRLRNQVKIPDRSSRGEPGTQWIEVYADSEKTVPEEDDRNNDNKIPVNITLSPELPDLIIEAIYYDAEGARQAIEERRATEFEVTVQVKNQGNVSTDIPFYIYCEYSANSAIYGTICSSRWSQEVGPLGPNASIYATGIMTFSTLPNESQEAIQNVSGYFLYAQVDVTPSSSRGRVWESNETNNWTRQQVD